MRVWLQVGNGSREQLITSISKLGICLGMNANMLRCLGSSYATALYIQQRH